jgi:hypothetical protein
MVLNNKVNGALRCVAAVALFSAALAACGSRSGTVTAPQVASTLTPVPTSIEQSVNWVEFTEADAARNIFDPQMVKDNHNKTLAVWEEFDGKHHRIWAKRRVAGQGWGNAVAIDTPNTGNAYHPRVSIDAQGNAMAVWQQIDGQHSSVRANRFDARMGWGNVSPLETTASMPTTQR